MGLVEEGGFKERDRRAYNCHTRSGTDDECNQDFPLKNRMCLPSEDCVEIKMRHEIISFASAVRWITLKGIIMLRKLFTRTFQRNIYSKHSRKKNPDGLRTFLPTFAPLKPQNTRTCLVKQNQEGSNMWYS